jgi:hypothetical protein
LMREFGSSSRATPRIVRGGPYEIRSKVKHGDFLE